MHKQQVSILSSIWLSILRMCFSSSVVSFVDGCCICKLILKCSQINLWRQLNLEPNSRWSLLKMSCSDRVSYSWHVDLSHSFHMSNNKSMYNLPATSNVKSSIVYAFMMHEGVEIGKFNKHMMVGQKVEPVKAFSSGFVGSVQRTRLFSLRN